MSTLGRAKVKAPRPYRSWLEYELAQKDLKALEYEPFSVQYKVEYEYTPDFVSQNGKVWYEVKGYFRDFKETKKFLALKDQYKGITIRFVLSNPDVRAYPQVKFSLADWCTKHGFEWCNADKIPEDWKA